MGPENPSVTSSEWLPWFHPFQMCHLWNLLYCTYFSIDRPYFVSCHPPFLGAPTASQAPPRPLHAGH